MPSHKKLPSFKELHSGLERPVYYRGRYTVHGYSAAVNKLALALTPVSFDPRLIAISDNFQLFRFKKLQVRGWFEYSASYPLTSSFYLAYTPVTPSVAPIEYELDEMPNFAVGNGTFGNQWPRLSLTTKELNESAPKWFRRGTAYDDLLETQGILYFSAPDSVLFSVRTISFVIEYEIELAGNMLASLTSRPPRVIAQEEKAADADLTKEVANLATIAGAVLVERPEVAPKTAATAASSPSVQGWIGWRKPA